MELEKIDALEAALKIGKNKAYELVRTGKIGPPIVIRVGASYRVNMDELEAWVKAGGTDQVRR